MYLSARLWDFAGERKRDGENGKEVEPDWQNYTVSFNLILFKADGFSSFRLHVQDSSILDLPLVLLLWSAHCGIVQH